MNLVQTLIFFFKLSCLTFLFFQKKQKFKKEAMILKKQPQTLLETLIALSLAVLVLSTLSFFFRQVEWLNQRLEKEEKANFEIRFLATRLSEILPMAVCETVAKKNFLFFSSEGGPLFKPGTSNLVFTFDNGINLKKGFSSHVIGRLFVDPKGRFCLAIWPSYELWEEGILPPMEKQVLLEKVEGLSFAFYTPVTKKPILTPPNKKPPFIEPENKGEWSPIWKNTYGELPSLVKVILKQKVDKLEKTYVFVFFLPSCRQGVVYNQ